MGGECSHHCAIHAHVHALHTRGVYRFKVLISKVLQTILLRQKREIPVKMVEIIRKDTTFTCVSKILSILSHMDTCPSDSNNLLIKSRNVGLLSSYSSLV